ncbi:putative phage holin [Streptomyces sp. bgisy154]|uniref:putative phage holin n=1 Tax=Streptomyces sp. bgisy154 TaxID=3413794 RepID=UPI003D71797E
MRDLDVDQWVNVVASGLAALACVVFAVTYHVRASWWRSEVGRNLMMFAAAVGVLCAHTVLVTFLHGDEHVLTALRSVRTVVLLLVAVLMVQRTWLLVKAQRESRDRTGV